MLMLIHMQQLLILFSLVQLQEIIFQEGLEVAMEVNSLRYQICTGKVDKWCNLHWKIEKINKSSKCQSMNQMIELLVVLTI